MDERSVKRPEKILLLLLPFWTPLIPPLGISCLKSFLTGRGYNVRTEDANLNVNLWETYHQYFTALASYIPEAKRGNYYNIGHNVLRNHLTASLYRGEEKCYEEIIQLLVEKHFFTKITHEQIESLDKIISNFYQQLEIYVQSLLEKEEPTVVGISVYTGTLAPALFTFKLIKEKFPHIMTVMGGGIFADQLAYGSPNFQTFLARTPYIDKIIIGEGELLFLKLLQGELPETERVFTLQDIDGAVLNLALANLPDFSDFELSRYPQLTSYASRSCPFQCSFCSETVQWGKYRKKDGVHIADELDRLSAQYGRQLFLLGDSLLNPVISELTEELRKRGVSIYFDGYLRADKDVCLPENAYNWRRGGFYRARLGVESGSLNVLNLMGKKITPDQIKAAIASLASAGIKTTTYWVIGHPGETEADFQETLDLITELKDDLYEAECNPFNYFPSGQVASDKFAQEHEISLLYPEKSTELLLTQTWIVHARPTREETYQRVGRFVNHCKKLGIPNPYSLQEIHAADERWKKLHKNAVPALVEFKQGTNIQENTTITKLILAQNPEATDGDFDF